MAKSKLPATAALNVKDKDGDGKIEDWEVESALSDMERAEKHKGNPKMMKRVAKLAGRKVKALKGISSLGELKQARDDHFMDKKKDSDGGF